ncbi:unnamed protein product [Camellia sinensis]
MASSNRHWPSMFKSKPCNTHHHLHQWHHHDLNNPALISTGFHTALHTSPSVAGSEERSPDPKPRWNPKPEQIRILESIFNSGMVNPPREEIRKIRTQLQEYGQVGDANVFYWFQNRKSRSKHKQQRHLQNTKPNTATAPSSSSSSSEKSSPQSSADNIAFSVGTNSPTASVNKTYFQNPAEFSPEPYFLPVQQGSGGEASNYVLSQGFCFPELSNNMVHVPNNTDQSVGNCCGFLLSELMMNHGSPKRVEDEKLKPQEQLNYTATHPIVPSTINHILGAGTVVGESSGTVSEARSTVFINDVAFEVAVGPFNVREAFGDDAMLIHSTGQPVVTNEWGVTLQSLQHGGFYYLLYRRSVEVEGTGQLVLH